MMKIRLDVKHLDGSGTAVEATVPDFIAFERKYDKPVSSFANDARIEYMCFLAWHAAKRQGITTQEFDPWLESVGELAIEPEGDIVPLESSQSTGG